MSIQIKNINVKNLGPISELSIELGNVNVFYGNNEKGKSYLVEFIIRSLFETSEWDLRENIGTGKINVEGLIENPKTFSPENKDKLIDFLSEQYSGLPPNFSKLLVVRGTNVSLGKRNESDREILRRFLSHKHILNKIRGNIQNTVQDCNITNFTISGSKRGKLKSRKELIKEIGRIDELYTELDDKFFGGELQNLKNSQGQVSEKYEKLKKAKKYKANQINQQIKKLNREIETIDKNTLNNLINDINGLNKDKQELEEKLIKLERFEKSTQHYGWLQKAINEYKEYNLGEIKEQPSRWILYTIIALFVITAVLIGIGMKWIGLGGLIVLLILSFTYKKGYDKYFKDSDKRNELGKIESDFQDRFNTSMDNLAIMEEKLEIMEADHNKKSFIEEDIKELKRRIRDSKLEIENKIFDYFGKEIEEENWREKLKEELERKDTLKDEKSKLQIKQNKLQVSEEEYITEEPEEDFSWDIYNAVENKKNKIEKNIKEKEEELERLKQAVCEHTGNNISEDWMKIVSNLSELRKDKIGEYKDITSDIMAGKYITEVIDDLIEKEDEKIHDALQSDTIKKTLPKVTTHYNEIMLKDDRLIVSDKFNSFPVSTISDGGQEQIFLALRIALAKEWFKKDDMFLILDDAFIHSDENRTPRLIDKTIQLSEDGWQILCFTFDDRIRDLFKQKSKDGIEIFDLNN